MATPAPRATGNGNGKSRTRTAQASAAPRADTTTAAEAASERDTTLDGAIDAWSNDAIRAQLGWLVALRAAMLRGARAWRETQLQAAERAETQHREAAERLQKAHGLADVASIQLDLARADADGAGQLFNELAAVAARSAFDILREATDGWMRANSAGWSAMSQWNQLQAAFPQNADILEAEVEHLTNPFGATPLVWPAQEATRQAFSLANSAWADWMNWPTKLAQASGSNIH